MPTKSYFPSWESKIKTNDGPKIELMTVNWYGEQKNSPSQAIAHSGHHHALPNPSTVHCCPPQGFRAFAKKICPKVGEPYTKNVAMVMLMMRRFEWVFMASPPMRCHCATMEWRGYSSHPDPILYLCHSCLAPLQMSISLHCAVFIVAGMTGGTCN